ncbi:MAG: nucleotide exchange factor GrpE, partial [Anaerolineae bacterium]|nr:nucleotide exchange factor GrpE [Anaerolineae bacterium]
DNVPASEEVELNIEKIASAMATFKAESERNLEGWQRERAEFQNYKRRVERDQKDIQRRSELDTIIKILPIVDDFERALANIPSDLLDNGWVHGTALILNKFKKLFEEYEIAMINPANEPFDPYLHQAIMREDSSEVESGHIIETLQKGYKSGDTILRPALVKVAN